VKTLPLTKGFTTVVDDADYDRVACFKWTALITTKGKVYAYRRGTRAEGQPVIYLHRFIIDASNDVEIDHRDSDGLNNCRNNLRVCSHIQNTRNSRRRSDNTSGFKGVHYDTNRKRWIAQVQINGRRSHIGAYRTREEAARAYDLAAVKYFGEFARLNFPHKAA
jgi:hypothetical protein